MMVLVNYKYGPRNLHSSYNVHVKRNNCCRIINEQEFYENRKNIINHEICYRRNGIIINIWEIIVLELETL